MKTDRRVTLWTAAGCLLATSIAVATGCTGEIVGARAGADLDANSTGTDGGVGLGDAGNSDDPCAACDGVAWQPLRLDFEGPTASELDDTPNPFLDYRMVVRFAGPSGQGYEVPGFFAGDGQGGASGDVWRVWFTADEGGLWSYQVAFEAGPAIAVAAETGSGTPIAPPLGPHGAAGSLLLAAPRHSAEGFLGRGRLRAVGAHYLRFADGSYWLKGGTDSPENLLAYSGFDATTQSRVYLHDYAAHIADWRPGDPDWGNGAGKGIIGALNYLADMHVNSLYALLMNIGGDGQDVWPFAGAVAPAGSTANDNTHYDISKLEQWETVFAHAERRGIALHLVLNEAEAANKRELDDGELGTERKLYYREMIARFGHHNAVQWNISEEYDLDFDLGVDRVKSFADTIQALDPYDHPITVHNSRALEAGWSGFGGFSLITLTSFQVGNSSLSDVIEFWRTWSVATGNPWVISIDEFTVQTTGQSLPWQPIYVPDEYRKLKIWPIYLSGGQLEFILAECLEVDDFAAFAQLWRETWHARSFIEENLPFWEMNPADALLSGEASYSNGYSQGAIGGQVLAKPGQVYAVYVPNATSTGTLDLSAASGPFTLRWYNPRTGTFAGDVVTVSGGTTVGLGTPPSDLSEDWTALLVAE